MSSFAVEHLGWGTLCLAGAAVSGLLAQAVGPDGTPGAVGGIGGGLAIGTAIGTGGGMIIAAIGNSLLKPWLETRVKAEALAALRTQVDTLTDDLARLTARYDQATSLTADQARKINLLTERNIALASAMLVQLGRIRPLPDGAGVVGDAPAPLDGPSVLLVEDEPVAREGLVSLLELLGHCRVAVAADFPQGVAALAAVPPPDFLMLDLMLPGGDGVDLLRIVKDRGLPTRVIVTTGRSEELLGTVRALKPLAVLRKPVDVPNDILPLILRPAPASRP